MNGTTVLVENLQKSANIDNPSSPDVVALDGQPETVKPATESTELDKYWKAVRENPADFTGWTYLLQYVEQENDLETGCEAFDAFLARYPYCYGYWKKYTDFLKKHDRMPEAEVVFERGVKAIPLSIDLWIHYINFANVKYCELTTKDEKIRTLFDRATVAAGTDFRSDKLWDMYISWEKENKDERSVMALYDRLLKIPTQLYSHHFDSFCAHVKQHHPKNLVSLDEFLRLRKEVAKATIEGHQTEEGGDTETPPTDKETHPPGEEEKEVEKEERPPGEEAPPGVDEAPPGEVVESPTKKPATMVDEEEVPLLREKIMLLRQELHKKTEEEVSMRWAFEERVRRPYFHVKPLERAQLRNWREYLDFEMQQGSHERVVVLFERCLIACALYEEFWLKYADYMEQHSLDGVRNVFQRACKIHLPKKPSLHLAWAAFEERQSNYEGAVEVYDSLERNVPGLAMVGMRRINLERRQGHLDHTETLYRSRIGSAGNSQEKSFFIIKYARYLAKVAKKVDEARAVLENALEEDKDNPKLLLQLVDLEYNKGGLDECGVLRQLDRAIDSSTMALEHRVAFSQRRLEFLEDFGTKVGSMMEAYDSHQKIVKELQSTRKRKAQDTENTALDTKKVKSDYNTEAATSAVPVSAPPAPLVVTTPVNIPPPTITPVLPNGITTDQHQVTSTTDTSGYYQQTPYNYNYGANYYGGGGWGMQYGYY